MIFMRRKKVWSHCCIKISLLFVALCTSHFLSAQLTRPTFFVETDFHLSTGDQIPFYLVSNRNGINSIQKNAALLRAAIFSSVDTSRKVAVNYGIDGVYRYDKKSKVWLQQGYAQLKLYFLFLQAGIKEEEFGNQDEQLSSGGYLFSANARPLPKIALYTDGYIVVPYTNDFLEFKGGISHGWFGRENQFVKDTYLHHKFIFVRFGEKELPISIDLGFQHAAMWGGVSPDSGKLPSDLKAFKSVFFCENGRRSGTQCRTNQCAG